MNEGRRAAMRACLFSGVDPQVRRARLAMRLAAAKHLRDTDGAGGDAKPL
jgi:hypothetical protein